MEINYETQLAEQQAEADKKALEQSNRKVWEKEILPRYHVRDWEANYRIACDYAGGELTLPKFEFMIQQENHGLSFGDEREKILAELKERLEDPYGRRLNSFDLVTKMKQYAYQPTHVLREKLKELITKQEMSKKSAGQLQEELRNLRQQQQQAYGWTDSRGMVWPKLLDSIVRPGTVAAVSTSQYLRELARRRDPESTSELRKLVRLYGNDQITRMMNAV